MGRWGILLFFMQGVLFGCAPSETDYDRLRGPWLFELEVDGHRLPFHVQVGEDSTVTVISVHNAAEFIEAEQVELKGDSLLLRLPVFNTAIRAKLLTDSTLRGEFIDYSRQGDYRIPLTGKKGELRRFRSQRPVKVDVSGTWSVGFSPNTADAYPAIGEFVQKDGHLTGTFLTTTGDFRFLEGVVSGDSVYLSGFDGAHALLFKARVKGDSISGSFWSGVHWFEKWKGVRNADARLPNPELLTTMRPGHSRLEFTFSDLDGRPVSLSDERFHGKVVIVQVMGSWCPNCLDETGYLVDLHKRMSPKGLEIVAVGFERGQDDAARMDNLRRLRDHFPVPYPILLGGSASKAEASEKLPMLSHVLSFPTTVFLDRKGRVRRIYTGFSGPGTGQHYEEFVARTETLVEELLEEKVVF